MKVTLPLLLEFLFWNLSWNLRYSNLEYSFQWWSKLVFGGYYIVIDFGQKKKKKGDHEESKKWGVVLFFCVLGDQWRKLGWFYAFGAGSVGDWERRRTGRQMNVKSLWRSEIPVGPKDETWLVWRRGRKAAVGKWLDQDHSVRQGKHHWLMQNLNRR